MTARELRLDPPLQPPVREPDAPPPPAQELDLLRGILDTLPLGLTLTDEEGRRVFSNPAAASLSAGTGGSGAETRLAPERKLLAVSAARRRFTLEMLTDVSAQREIEEALFRKAYFDEMTGLPSRSLIRQGIEDLIASTGRERTFALAFIDIDNFKHINDYYGHDFGDQLLIGVADRLSDFLRSSDLAARIGGDEFLVLLNPLAGEQELGAMLTRLKERLLRPYFIDGHEIFTSASIGVSLFPDHGRSFDALRQSADSAMYRIKGGPKGQVAIFDATTERRASARMKLEQRLRLAIRDRRFCCAFQPKVNLRTLDVVGVEILLRWRDEEGVIQAPGDFVSLAVELGLINEIANIALGEVMAAMPEIDRMFGPAVTVSLNIAAKQAEDPVFMLAFIRRLAETGHARRVMIELTEEAFFSRSRFQLEFLPKLRAIGTKVSIDDFGVGYSSLSALADITADEIKIDRSFITDVHLRPRSQSVLRAIISLAEALKMSVVAEGVETAEELDYLRDHTTIDQVQGYYFSRPQILGEETGGGASPAAALR